MSLWRNEKHEYFASGTFAGDMEHYFGEPEPLGPFVSVTTALKALDKSGPLVGWAKRETAACAVRNLEMLDSMVKSGGPDAAQKWLSNIPDYQRDTAADIGTRVHAIAEALNNGQPIPDEEAQNPKVRAYQSFVAEWEPEFVGVEQMVINFSEGYAGTADIFASLPTGGNGPLDGIHFPYELWLIDIKTSKLDRGPYEDHWLQLAGLNAAEWWGWPDREEFEPAQHATRFGILQLADTGYTLWEGRIGPAEYGAFRDVLHVHNWLEGPLKEVKIGKVNRNV